MSGLNALSWAALDGVNVQRENRSYICEYINIVRNVCIFIMIFTIYIWFLKSFSDVPKKKKKKNEKSSVDTKAISEDDIFLDVEGDVEKEEFLSE